MANWKVTIKGTGQLNGPVPINKTVEMDERAAKAFTGSKKSTAIEAFVQTHYPGVQIDPRKFSANVNPIKSKKSKSRSTKSNTGKALIGGAIGAAIWNELKSEPQEEEPLKVRLKKAGLAIGGIILIFLTMYILHWLGYIE